MKNDLPDFRADPNGYFRLGRSLENPNVMESESDKVPVGDVLPGSGKSTALSKSESDNVLSLVERLMAVRAYHEGIIDEVAVLQEKKTSIFFKNAAIQTVISKHRDYLGVIDEACMMLKHPDGIFEQAVARTRRLALMVDGKVTGGRWDDNGKRV